MEGLIKTTLIGLFFGTFGTTLGGGIGVSFKNTSKKFLGLILSLAAGLMTAIVCFELIPEAMELDSIFNVIIGIIFGIICMVICDILVNSRFNKKNIKSKYENLNKTNSMLKTGIIISIGLAIHNLPEGLAIGSGFEASITLGYSLAIAIALHDIPEGISMAVPMKKGGMRKLRVLLYVFLSGITTGIGAFLGALIGNISQEVIAICLSFAAGAMLYIVSGELVPESNNMYKGRMNAIANILGFILGIFSSIF